MNKGMLRKGQLMLEVCDDGGMWQAGNILGGGGRGREGVEEKKKGVGGRWRRRRRG